MHIDLLLEESATGEHWLLFHLSLLSPKQREKLGDEMVSRYKQITGFDIPCHRSGTLKARVEFGQLTGRKLEIAASTLHNRVTTQMIEPAKRMRKLELTSR